MNIESLLDQIEDILEAGTKVPLSNKTGVDAAAIRTAIEDIRLNLPNEITQARAIVADRNNILIKAKDEAGLLTKADAKKIAALEEKLRKAHEDLAKAEEKVAIQDAKKAAKLAKKSKA